MPRHKKRQSGKVINMSKMTMKAPKKAQVKPKFKVRVNGKSKKK